jgi:hypothetical protein
VVEVAANWDPNQIARDAEATKYQVKGNRLTCLLGATDEGAGNAWPDSLNRTPKSARSTWPGTLEGMFARCEARAALITKLTCKDELRMWG